MGKAGAKEGNKNAEKWTEELSTEFISELKEWLKIEDNIFYEQFLQEKGLYRSSTALLREKFESFRTLEREAKEYQELKLAKLGLKGKLNPTMTIFVLKNCHDYKDKSEVKNDTSVSFEWNEVKNYGSNDKAD